MQNYKHTQPGIFSIIIILPILIFLIILFILSGFDNIVSTIIFGVVITLLFVCLLIFYKLTITINTTHISFSLGTGLIKRKFSLNDIEKCRPVKNSVWYGIGIRFIPDGWLYNVSGLYAIELTFKNKKSKIRIGTDKPEEISGIINKLLNKPGTEYIFDHDYHRNHYALLAFALLVLAVPVLITVYGCREIKLEFSDSGLKIKGMYGMFIKYQDIIKTDTISILPDIKIRTNGFAAARNLKGNFRLQDNTKAKLFIKKNIPPYINIKTEENNIFINFSNAEKTISLYKKISATYHKNR
ncbi:MAG: hypothetical protein ACUVTX_06385 [Bacteroidales bacterium]